MTTYRWWTRTGVVAGLGFGLAACGSMTPHWWTKPGVTETEFRQHNTGCIRQATKAKPGGASELDGEAHQRCLEDLGYYATETGKGWHDGRK